MTLLERLRRDGILPPVEPPPPPPAAPAALAVPTDLGVCERFASQSPPWGSETVLFVPAADHLAMLVEVDETIKLTRATWAQLGAARPGRPDDRRGDHRGAAA